MGCDTFVVLPSHSRNGNVVFGKNSDRPQGEVQEVTYFRGKTIESDTAELEVIYNLSSFHFYRSFYKKILPWSGYLHKNPRSKNHSVSNT